MQKKIIAALAVFSLFALTLPASASNLDPTASFFASPSSGGVGTTFIFDASASTDYTGFKTGLQYRWDFEYNSGTTGFSSWSSASTTTHAYDEADDYTVALEVENSSGSVDRTYMTITVQNTSFNGYIEVDQSSGDTNTQFTFEAIITRPSGYSEDDFDIRWDFDGDDVWDTNYSTALVTTHVYGDTGLFTPHLEVRYAAAESVEVWGWRDDTAGSDDVQEIVISSSAYPQGSLDVYPSSGTTNTEFSFDGSNSFDSQDYHDLEFRYDFEGDGIFDTEWSEDATAEHSYDTSGDWQIIMQVRDSDDNTDEVYVDVTVSDSDTEPTAVFSITNDRSSTDKTIGTTSTTFTFNASSSSDLEDSSSELQVRWDFDGDADWDTTFSTTKTATNRYLETGEFTVTLQVLDTAGNYDTDTDTITIVENTAPSAVLTVDPLEGTSGTKFTFDASDSSDDQYLSSYLEVRFDFDGDGSYDTEFSTLKSQTHYYEEDGTYDAVVQVQDPEGQSSTATVTVTVLSNTSPSANFDLSPDEGTYSTLFSFDASDSSDSQTDSDDLQYRWDFNYGGESDLLYDTTYTTNPKTSHYFDESVGTGTISVRLEVKDEDGELSHAIKNISLHWASPYLQEMKQQGIMSGYTGGDMKPDQAITRAELTKMVLKAIEETTSGVQYSATFSDVATVDWFWAYVLKAYNLSLVSGYSDGSFGPNNSINRAEALKIILNAFDVSLVSDSEVDDDFSDVSVDDWYARYVQTAFDEGLVSGYGDGVFGPGNSLTRGEAAKILYTALQKWK